MTIIYGVDTDKPINSKDVRDAIVECFTQAHDEALSDLKDYDSNLTDVSFESIKRINVRQLIRNFFDETGGDFDSPTHDSILKVIENLKKFAENFRNKSIIEKHFQEIKILVDKIPN